MTQINQHRHPDEPSPGHYACRLVRGGPEVACRIIETAGLWVLLIAMEPTHPEAQRDPWKCPRMDWVAFSRRISTEEYDRLLDAAAAAKPGDPLADPLKPIRWRDAPPPY